MDEILDRCGSATAIANDITVHGKDDKESNQHFLKFIHIANDYSLILNLEKCMIKATSVTYFRCMFDSQSVHPNPDKVSTICVPGICHIAQGVANGHVFASLNPFALNTYCNPVRLVEERCQLLGGATYQKTFNHVKLIPVVTQHYITMMSITHLSYRLMHLSMVLVLHLSKMANTWHSNSKLSPQFSSIIEQELLAVVTGAKCFHIHVGSKFHHYEESQTLGADKSEDLCQ